MTMWARPHWTGSSLRGADVQAEYCTAPVSRQHPDSTLVARNAYGRNLVADDKVKVTEYRLRMKATFILNN